MGRAKEFLTLVIAVTIVFAITVGITELVRQLERTDMRQDLESAMFMIVEKAYFDGQRDYMEGDIRITVDADSNVVWSKPIWNDGRDCLYQPIGQRLETH